MTGPRDATAFEVREALAESGCVVCRLSLRSVTRQLRSIAYEQVNDIDLRAQLRQAGGFCNPHAHQWLREANSVLGTALIYRDVLQAALKTLDEPPVRGRGLRKLLGASPTAQSCPACRAQSEGEARYLEVLLALLAADDAPSVGDGLCRRHTLAAARSGRPGADVLQERARSQVEAIVADLEEVIRKEDYRFREEPRSEAERAAPIRAVDWAAGLDGLI